MEEKLLIQEMGIKNLEHIVLKAREDTYMYGREYEAGEPVLYFENVQIAQLTENAQIIAAKGGFMNQPRVIWEDRGETMFSFSNGTLNIHSLNMLLEANIVHRDEVAIPFKEYVDIERGRGYLKHIPLLNKKVFCFTYDVNNIQTKIVDFNIEINEEQTEAYLVVGEDYNGQTLLLDYYFDPDSTAVHYTMSRERKPNLYTLEATFYLKDENDGLLHTGLLEMPKVYIMSNVNLRMGERADPTVGTFRIMAMPENTDGYDDLVYKITYLDEDIYGI